MLISRILIFLAVVSLANFKIPLKKHINKEKLANATSTDLPTVQTLSTSYLYNYYNTQYIADIYAGSSLQWVSVLVATASPWFWIPSISCTNCHSSFSYFNKSKSTTYKYIGANYKADYVVGYAKGDLSSDTFRIGDNSYIYAYDQKFLLSKEDSGFSVGFFDGVLGLEYNSLNFGYPTFLDNLKSKGQISRKLFSIYLSDNYFLDSNYDGSAIIFGGYDLSYAQSTSIKYVLLNQINGKWQLKLSNIKVNGWSISSSAFIASFDIGTSLMMAPSAEFYSIVSEIALYGDCWWEGGFLNCDCKINYSIYSYPEITFMLGSSYTFNLDPWDYFLQSDSTCVLLFLENSGGGWAFGDPFFRKYYTIFDADYGMMGFVDAVRYSTVALSADSSIANKIKAIDRETLIQKDKNQQEKAESSMIISYWAISGILISCLSGFVYFSYKMKKSSDQEIPYHKIFA